MNLTSKIISSALVGASFMVSVEAMATDIDKIKVMSRNIYLGADIFPVLAAAQNPDPVAVPMAVTGVFQSVQASNFPERAQALADEIGRHKPDVIGLQEVSTWRTQIPGDFLLGNPTQASDVAYDFLEILQAALSERGLHYNVAASVDNADLELPFIAGVEADGVTPLFGDLRLSDRDVILVKDSRRISYSTTITGNFAVNGITSVGGTSIEFTRGYTMADVTVRGVDYRFVNTHLETGGSEPYMSLQAVQMNELMQVISATTNPSTPVILLGDFNSSPTEGPFISTSGIPGLDGLPLVPPYLQAVGSGYIDTWLSKPKARDGYTCCFDAAVSDEDATLYERIDHIFFNPKDREISKLKVKLVGQSNADMTDESALYPSDHAGLFGKIKLEKQ
ncbi:MAG: endonuclease/exonuclease/phosphatase family protein [Hahellaceae bacterium]|nr:endonuclease/exonuclease/phosphatase family protein [Hahellaceae bacterium]MCP5210366.1 endonuclease/exonuclease/phosphatase family protein [Hahellaceae bacterium]